MSRNRLFHVLVGIALANVIARSRLYGEHKDPYKLHPGMRNQTFHRPDVPKRILGSCLSLESGIGSSQNLYHPRRSKCLPELEEP